MKLGNTHKGLRTREQASKGDRLHWQPLREARQATVSVKACNTTGKQLQPSELSKRSNNGNSTTLVP
tara:strand:+ start:326 stop:526 length:201 start_codon:yes stop_codon:yes gene_type:complete